jgi:putative oxidoreductase
MMGPFAERILYLSLSTMAQYADSFGMHAYGTGTTLRDYGPFVLRLALGTVFLAHGGQKLFGLWGGAGLNGTAAGLGQLGLHPASPLALATGIVEFAGGILLILGAFTIVSAATLIVTMLAAIWKVHFANGFFLNWTITPGQGHGYEYNLALIGGLVCLALTGSGALSVDRHRAESAASEAAGRARLRAGNV